MDVCASQRYFFICFFFLIFLTNSERYIKLYINFHTVYELVPAIFVWVKKYFYVLASMNISIYTVDGKYIPTPKTYRGWPH